MAFWRQFRYQNSFIFCLVFLSDLSECTKNIRRDPQNGFWCDNLRLNNLVPCGAQNNFYSAAGTGMGLVTEAIMVELGLSKLMMSLVRGH